MARTEALALTERCQEQPLPEPKVARRPSTQVTELSGRLTESCLLGEISVMDFAARPAKRAEL